LKNQRHNNEDCWYGKRDWVDGRDPLGEIVRILEEILGKGGVPVGIGMDSSWMDWKVWKDKRIRNIDLRRWKST